MSEIELPAVSDVKILRLRPNDTIVVSCLLRLSDQEYEDLGTRLREHFPDNPIAVLEGGMTIEVLRAEVPREE